MQEDLKAHVRPQEQPRPAVKQNPVAPGLSFRQGVVIDQPTLPWGLLPMSGRKSRWE